MKSLRVLHLEDDAKDAFLLKNAVERSGIEANWVLASNAKDFHAALKHGGVDMILSDTGLPNFSGHEALLAARKIYPDIPFIFVSGAGDEDRVMESLAAGADDYVLKSQPWQLIIAIRRFSAGHKSLPVEFSREEQPMRKLVEAIQKLSTARSLKEITGVVRRMARELTGADGASFILRDGDKCHYLDEDAIAPLWKGQKFPMNACVSGWVMLNRQPAVIPDIYADERVPAEAYRPTFVKSMVMVPIRTESPMGVIGTYWGTPHVSTAEEVELLEALANTTAVAMENVRLYDELDQRMRDRTIQLEATNRELETFSYSVSHDLKAPLRQIQGYAELLAEELSEKVKNREQEYLSRIMGETRHMGRLIDDLLTLSRFTRTEPRREKVNLTQVARELAFRLKANATGRVAEFIFRDGLEVQADTGLMRVVMDNLLSNAWKFTTKQEKARIEFGAATGIDGTLLYFIRDNGVGFDMRYAGKLFAPFQRLHRQEEFAGTGVGLATAQRIIHRHGGRIWAEAAMNQGATFFFTLPRTQTQTEMF